MCGFLGESMEKEKRLPERLEEVTDRANRAVVMMRELTGIGRVPYNPFERRYPPLVELVERTIPRKEKGKKRR